MCHKLLRKLEKGYWKVKTPKKFIKLSHETLREIEQSGDLVLRNLTPKEVVAVYEIILKNRFIKFFKDNKKGWVCDFLVFFKWARIFDLPWSDFFELLLDPFEEIEIKWRKNYDKPK